MNTTASIASSSTESNEVAHNSGQQVRLDAALIDAARQGDSDRVRALIESGANPNAQCNRGKTFFQIGFRFGPRDSALQACLRAGTPGAIRTALTLIESGADPRYVNNWGERAEHHLNRLAYKILLPGDLAAHPHLLYLRALLSSREAC